MEESNQSLHGNLEQAVEIEQMDILYDIKDLLGDLKTTNEVIMDRIKSIEGRTKEYDYFQNLLIDVSEAHSTEREEFTTTINKLVIMPVPLDFTLWVGTVDIDSKYELKEGESVDIERACDTIFYTNEGTSVEKVRIHLFSNR